MKALMSINWKFMNVIPSELVTFIKNNSKYCQGIEINVDYNKPNEVNYLKELAFVCKKEDFHLQIHANSNLDIDKQLEYMHMLESLSDMLDYKINVVLHSIYDDIVEESIHKTIDYLNQVLDNVDNNKLTITLENLNSLHKEYRLNKHDITEIILNDDRLFFTYDIGHDLIENGGITDIDEYLVKEIANVHIHTYNYDSFSDCFDHKLIFKDDPHWNQLLKGIQFLKINHYEGPIVYEYALDFCIGYSIYDKIKYFLSSLDYVHERFDK